MNREEMYPCADCGKLRTKDEGGTTFTVCDECWDKHYGKNKIAELEKENAKLKQEIEELEKELKQIKKMSLEDLANRKLVFEIAKLKQEIEELKSENKKLKEQLGRVDKHTIAVTINNNLLRTLDNKIIELDTLFVAQAIVDEIKGGGE